jgi:hypothetical protein
LQQRVFLACLSLFFRLRNHTRAALTVTLGDRLAENQPVLTLNKSLTLVAWRRT